MIWARSIEYLKHIKTYLIKRNKETYSESCQTSEMQISCENS